MGSIKCIMSCEKHLPALINSRKYITNGFTVLMPDFFTTNQPRKSYQGEEKYQPSRRMVIIVVIIIVVIVVVVIIIIIVIINLIVCGRRSPISASPCLLCVHSPLLATK